MQMRLDCKQRKGNAGVRWLRLRLHTWLEGDCCCASRLVCCGIVSKVCRNNAACPFGHPKHKAAILEHG